MQATAEPSNLQCKAQRMSTCPQAALLDDVLQVEEADVVADSKDQVPASKQPGRRGRCKAAPASAHANTSTPTVQHMQKTAQRRPAESHEVFWASHTPAADLRPALPARC